MNELKNMDMRTPIEIALQIDENGHATARALYEFLEMDKSHFSRWAEKNIEKNEFYEENEDWWGFAIMANGNNCKDYKLTTDFAKHLCMESHSAKGKIARQYFVKIEDKAKEIAINRSQLSPQMQMFYAIADEQAKMELEQKRLAKEVAEVKQTQETISDVLAKTTDEEEFRKWCKRQISKIVNLGKFDKGSDTKDKYRYAWEESFERLAKKRPCNLKQRVSNEKGRALTNGKPKSWIDQNINTLSVICDDKNLRPAYESVLREMTIYYCVKIA